MHAISLSVRDQALFHPARVIKQSRCLECTAGLSGGNERWETSSPKRATPPQSLESGTLGKSIVVIRPLQVLRIAGWSMSVTAVYRQLSDCSRVPDGPSTSRKPVSGQSINIDSWVSHKAVRRYRSADPVVSIISPKGNALRASNSRLRFRDLLPQS